MDRLDLNAGLMLFNAVTTIVALQEAVDDPILGGKDLEDFYARKNIDIRKLNAYLNDTNVVVYTHNDLTVAQNVKRLSALKLALPTIQKDLESAPQEKKAEKAKKLVNLHKVTAGLKGIEGAEKLNSDIAKILGDNGFGHLIGANAKKDAEKAAKEKAAVEARNKEAVAAQNQQMKRSLADARLVEKDARQHAQKMAG